MRLVRAILVISAFCLSTGAASAANLAFTGNFITDDQLEVFLFTAPTANTMVRTWGYAGGTNALGQLIFAGGFDPILSVFDATGGLLSSSLLLASNDDGVQCPTNAPACVSPDPATASAWDSLLVLAGLNPGGTYALVLSEADNFANGPDYGSGFFEAGQGDFTAVDFPCGGPAFCDQNLAQRTGAWAVDITGVGGASDITNGSVPEPGSILLIATGLTGLVLLRRRRQHN